MRFFHLSDLHLGKRLHEYSLREDQADILEKILEAVRRERPDAVLLSGDLYEKTMPSAESVQLLNLFLEGLAAAHCPVLAIYGNHDSPERTAYGGGLFRKARIYVSPVFDGIVRCVTLEDSFGEVDFYLLPFLKPATVRSFFPEAAIESYTDAVRTVLEATRRTADPTHRKVLLAHQFVTGALRSDSEETVVGGLDNVDASVFEGFDYVALGHIHRPQNAGSERIRYSGSPLKYSFSEAEQEKSISLVTLGEKQADGMAALKVEELPLTPLHELRCLRGSYEELTARSFYAPLSLEDYYRITLTDESDVPGALQRLRTLYHNLMELAYDNRRTRTRMALGQQSRAESRTPEELFADFFRGQNGREMNLLEQKMLAQALAEREVDA